MIQKKDSSVSSEVKERLEKLFSEDDGADDDNLFQDNMENPVDSEIRELKAVVLSIDWEINDEIMSGLMKQIDALKKIYQQDQVLILFLQLLGTVGKYIQQKKAKAHPDSIKLLNSAYQSFEKAVTNKQLSEADRKKLLQTEIKRYKELKNQISSQRKAPVVLTHETGEYQREQEKNRPESSNFQISSELTFVMEEIKKIIQAEFKILREELRSWKEKKR